MRRLAFESACALLLLAATCLQCSEAFKLTLDPSPVQDAGAITSTRRSLSESTGCECLGAAHPNATRFGADYGKRCAAHDVIEPTKLWPTVKPAVWSCQSWCYVNNATCNATDVTPSWDTAQTNLYFSYQTCEDEPLMTEPKEKCPWEGKDLGDTIDWKTTTDYNPCGCNGDTQNNTEKFGTGYGGTCDAWDSMKCGPLWPTYKPGSWCCEDWCYTSQACPTSDVSWEGGTGNYYNYGTCANNATYVSDCHWKPNDKGRDPKWTESECMNAAKYPTAAAIVGGSDMLEACKDPEEDPVPKPSERFVNQYAYNGSDTCASSMEIAGASTLETYFPNLMGQMGIAGWNAGLSCFDTKDVGQPDFFGDVKCTPGGSIGIFYYLDGDCKQPLNACGGQHCASFVSNPVCMNQTQWYKSEVTSAYSSTTKCEVQEAKKPRSGCKCKGVDHPNATRFGAGYGARCAAHDVYKSTEFWPTYEPAKWSCQSWCYVDNTTCNQDDVASSWDEAQTGLYYSYDACEDDPRLATNDQCPWVGVPKGGEVAEVSTWKYDPCSCSGDTQKNTDKFGTGYGGTCDAWDSMKCGPLWPTYKPGSWCCEDWCYTSQACPTSDVSWEGGTGNYYNYGTCANNATYVSDCHWKPNDKGRDPKWTESECMNAAKYPTAAAIVGGSDMLEACKDPEEDPVPPPSNKHVHQYTYNGSATCNTTSELSSSLKLEDYFPILMGQMGIPGWTAGLSCFDTKDVGQPDFFADVKCTPGGKIGIYYYLDGDCEQPLIAPQCGGLHCASFVSNPVCTNQTQWYESAFSSKTMCVDPPPPPSPPPPPPMPPPAEPQVADISIVLGGYTKDTFDAAAQTAFKKGIAAASDKITEDKVKIISVDTIPLSGSTGRHLAQAAQEMGINVDFQVEAESTSVAEALGMELKKSAESGDLVKTLKTAGLTKTTSTKLTALNVMSPAKAKEKETKAKTPPSSTPTPTSPAAKSFAGVSMIAAALIALLAM